MFDYREDSVEKAGVCRGFVGESMVALDVKNRPVYSRRTRMEADHTAHVVLVAESVKGGGLVKAIFNNP